jgi:hypothetical protein
MGKKPLLVSVVIILTFIFVFVFFRALFSTMKGTSPEVQKDETSSSQKIYYQSGTFPAAGVPYKTVTDPGYSGVSIFWVRKSSDAGNDTCTLYDNSTNQIYANRYQNNGQIGGPKSGWMYYTNDQIGKDKATSFLDSVCFK